MTWWGWLIIAAVILLIIIWGISVQRKLVNLDELCGNAMSQIGVQQNTRWDALTALADLTKQYDEHEYQTLMDVIAQRKPVGSQSTAEDAQKQENILTEAMDKFLALGEAYPDLKATDMYQNTMNGVKQYEENVRLARMSYNDTVTRLNRTIRQFPDSIIAGMLHYQTRTYLEAEDSKKEMPSMKR